MFLENLVWTVTSMVAMLESALSVLYSQWSGAKCPLHPCAARVVRTKKPRRMKVRNPRNAADRVTISNRTLAPRPNTSDYWSMTHRPRNCMSFANTFDGKALEPVQQRWLRSMVLGENGSLLYFTFQMERDIPLSYNHCSNLLSHYAVVILIRQVVVPCFHWWN